MVRAVRPFDTRRIVEAESTLAQRGTLRAQNQFTPGTLLGSGRTILARGDRKAAEPFISEAVAMLRAMRPFDTPRIAEAERALARARAATGDPR